MNNITEMNVTIWLFVEPFLAICGVAHVKFSIDGILTLSRVLLKPYHCFYIKRFYKDDWLDHDITETKRYKQSLNALNNG